MDVSKSVDGTLRATITVEHRVGLRELVAVSWEVLRHCEGEGVDRLSGLTRENLMEEVEIWFERQGRGFFYHHRVTPELEQVATLDHVCRRVRELFPEFGE